MFFGKGGVSLFVTTRPYDGSKNTTRKISFLLCSMVYKKGAHVANLNVHAFYIASRGTGGERNLGD